MKKHFFSTASLKLIGLLIGLLGLGLFLLATFWKVPQPPNFNVSVETQQIFKATTTVGDSSTQMPHTDQFITKPAQSLPGASIQTPTPVWMIYNGIDFRDKEVEALLTMQCNQDTVYMANFQVVPYSPEVMASGEFMENLDFSIAWEHLGFYGLWVHSGLAYGIGELTAYPLQTYLEKDERGFFRSPSTVEEHLQNCVINAEMHMLQENTISVSKVVAAVRVPPSEVEEVSRHTMDLVPYLAETYPDSGFDQMVPPGLVFYFCGQQLTGEMANPNYGKWTQARFIIGFMPVTAD
jgi:hypothetical protein